MSAKSASVVGFLGLAVFLAGVGPEAAAQSKGSTGGEKVWEGTLSAGGVNLPLILHVTGSDAGSFEAKLDSPSQNALGLKVDSIKLGKTMLKFDMNELQAGFEGKLNAEGTEAVGKWTQGGISTPLTFKRKSEAELAATKTDGKEDVWEGKIALPGGLSLRMVFHVSKTAGGSFVATFDSPDQGAKGLKVDSVSLDKTTLKFEMKQLQGQYVGTLNEEGTEAVGDWTQGGAKLPLTLKKVEKASEAARPQTPKPPFPYQSIDVSYPNKAGGISLAGTLTEPTGRGPFPAVIMISGSGAQDRDETILGHKPFQVIADSLTRRGIAVLRVNDRGVGGSTGQVSTSTSEDFAGDVLTGIAFLKSRSEINPKQIGLIGHSEGGIIAPMVAVKAPEDVAFIVLMAGTGLPGDQILRMQAKLIYESMGTKGEKLQKVLDSQAELIKIAMTETDEAVASRRMREVMDRDKASATPEERKKLEDAGKMVDAQLSSLRSKWFKFFLSYDPRPTLSKVRCPVLALIGEKDLQVPSKENLAEIEKVLKKAGNTKSSVRELPSLNHLFQTCKTGSPAEYAAIEETIAPSALRAMGDWITEQVRSK